MLHYFFIRSSLFYFLKSRCTHSMHSILIIDVFIYLAFIFVKVVMPIHNLQKNILMMSATDIQMQ